VVKFKTYPDYTESGIEWLGDIPDHWEVKKFKHYYVSSMGNTILKEELSEDSVTPVYSATELVEILGYIDNPSVILYRDDFIIPARGNSIGHVKLVVDEECTCTQTTIYAKKQYPGRINPSFVYWYQIGLRKKLYEFDNTAIPQLTVRQVKENPILVPQMGEQQAIASFLDRETARIDALIQKKERMIELLKEKRIALITQAVTKGLNPNVPMKDSGIEWLGEVPEHWEVKRLKYVSSCNDESLPETTDPDFEILYVDISSVSRILGITAKEEMSFEDAPSRARRKVKDGDTIVSTVRTYLRAIAPIENAEDNLIVSTGFAVLRPVSVYSGYLSLVIQSHFVVESIVAMSVGVSYPAINASDIGDICITNPPLSEQREIVDKVRKATSRIDEMQSKNEQSITILHEYRSSLIHSAVTGKIDLRDYHDEL